ncbi:MAG: DUF2007 domain-containing protein [Hyphomicrobiales bacterium]
MDVTRESLQESLSLLSDDELLGQFHSGELTGLAQEVASAELRSRGVRLTKPEAEAASEERHEEPPDFGEGDLVQVARFLTPMEAEILRGRLEAEGVQAMVADTNMVQVNWLLGPVIGGVRVLVSESHLERAQEILKAVRRGDYALKDDAAGGQ